MGLELGLDEGHFRAKLKKDHQLGDDDLHTDNLEEMEKSGIWYMIWR